MVKVLDRFAAWLGSLSSDKIYIFGKDFGVLQPLWNAWREAEFEDCMDADYFKDVLKHQIKEIESETEQGRLWDEWIDVICVALNYLRTTSITPENIGKAAVKRAIRYKGKTKEIQEKYKEMENGERN